MAWRSGFGEEDAVTAGESGLELSLGLPAYFSSSKPSEGSTAAPAFALQYNGTTASKPRFVNLFKRNGGGIKLIKY